ncbi:MAG TPA: hypothetical protein VF000_06675 [Agromyces sp.]
MNARDAAGVHLQRIVELELQPREHVAVATGADGLTGDSRMPR